jgi:hypothetical protein
LALFVVAGGAWWFIAARGPEPARLSLTVPPSGALVFKVRNSAGAHADFVGQFEFDSEFAGILTLRTRSLDSDGARVSGILDVSRLIWNGRPETGKTPLRARFTLRPDANFTGCSSFDSGAPAGTFDPLVTGLTPDLPPGEVRPGDTWTDEYDGCRKKALNAHVNTWSKFLRYDEVKGVRIAVVRGTRSIEISANKRGNNGATGTINVDQMAWIDPDDGRVVKMTATVSGNVTIWEGKSTFKARTVERLVVRQL